MSSLLPSSVSIIIVAHRAVSCGFYFFVCERAFEVPEGLERLKHTLLAESKGLRFARSKKIVLRQVRSIPSVGLKVGDFHMLERESTAIFVEYVLKNIVNLFVSLYHQVVVCLMIENNWHVVVSNPCSS